mgnify:CR=1 FL=1
MEKTAIEKVDAVLNYFIGIGDTLPFRTLDEIVKQLPDGVFNKEQSGTIVRILNKLTDEKLLYSEIREPNNIQVWFLSFDGEALFKGKPNRNHKPYTEHLNKIRQSEIKSAAYKLIPIAISVIAILLTYSQYLKSETIDKLRDKITIQEQAIQTLNKIINSHK